MVLSAAVVVSRCNFFDDRAEFARPIGACSSGFDGIDQFAVSVDCLAQLRFHGCPFVGFAGSLALSFLLAFGFFDLSESFDSSLFWSGLPTAIGGLLCFALLFRLLVAPIFGFRELGES